MKLPTKLSGLTFQRFWDLHAWAGVIVGLLLHVCFFFGVCAVFYHQLHRWEDPVMHREAPASLDALAPALRVAFPAAGDAWITLPEGGVGVPTACAQSGPDAAWTCAAIDPRTGEVVAEREQLASFVYRLHFLWHDRAPFLYYVAGAAAMAMLLIVVTGLLIHWKDLLRQLHRFRRDRGQRVLWSDMHKVLGVMGTPFQLVYAFTGALMILGPFLLGAFVGPTFGGDRERAEAVALGETGGEEPPPPSGPPGAWLPLDELIARARERLPGLEPRSLELAGIGKADGTVEVEGRIPGLFHASGHVMVRGSDGAVVHVEDPAEETVVGGVRRWLYGLHYATYGGILVRGLAALLALATCLTILTGNWIWLNRRFVRTGRRGDWLLARLTVGFGSGLAVATAAVFLASRVIPLDADDRGGLEQLVFLTTWGATLGWALIAGDGLAVWRRQLVVAGVGFAATPIAAARLSDAGLFGGAPLAAIAGVDAALLAVGLACAALAWRLGRVREVPRA